MTDDVSKPALGDGVPSLPAWPEEPQYLCMAAEWLDYTTAMTNAYRARMEALKKYAQHEDGCRSFNPTEDHGHWDLSCDCGLDALLAACEREGER